MAKKKLTPLQREYKKALTNLKKRFKTYAQKTGQSEYYMGFEMLQAKRATRKQIEFVKSLRGENLYHYVATGRKRKWYATKGIAEGVEKRRKTLEAKKRGITKIPMPDPKTAWFEDEALQREAEKYKEKQEERAREWREENERRFQEDKALEEGRYSVDYTTGEIILMPDSVQAFYNRLDTLYVSRDKSRKVRSFAMSKVERIKNALDAKVRSFASQAEADRYGEYIASNWDGISMALSTLEHSRYLDDVDEVGNDLLQYIYYGSLSTDVLDEYGDFGMEDDYEEWDE